MKNRVKAMLAALAVLIASLSLLAATRSNVAANSTVVSGDPITFSNYGPAVLAGSYVTHNYFVTIQVSSSTGPFYLEKLIINQIPTTTGIAFTDLYGTIDFDNFAAGSGQLSTGGNVCFKASFATPKSTGFGPPGDIIQSMYTSTYGRYLLEGNSPPAGGLSIEASGAIEIHLFPDNACSKILPANDDLAVTAVVVAPSSATISLTFING